MIKKSARKPVAYEIDQEESIVHSHRLFDAKLSSWKLNLHAVSRNVVTSYNKPEKPPRLGYSFLQSVAENEIHVDSLKKIHSLNTFMVKAFVLSTFGVTLLLLWEIYDRQTE